MRLTIFDIDGTLGGFCYEGSEGSVEDDLPGGVFNEQKLSRQVPYAQMRPIVQRAVQDPQTVILFLTGRKDYNYRVTRDWIMEHFHVKDPILICRPDDLPHGGTHKWKVKTLINQWRMGDFEFLDIYDDADFWKAELPEAFRLIALRGGRIPKAFFYEMKNGWLVNRHDPKGR